VPFAAKAQSVFVAGKAHYREAITNVKAVGAARLPRGGIASLSGLNQA